MGDINCKIMQRRDLIKAGAAGAMVSAISFPLLGIESDTLHQIALSRGLRFGTAVSLKTLGDPDYAQLVMQHSGTLVAENAFKWQYLEPTERRYDDREARWMSSLSQSEGKRMRGHCFLWNHHDRMPPWLVDLAARTDPKDAGDVTRHMWRHASYLARNYPEVDCWDAMNEVIDPKTGRMRETHFTSVIGNRFFDLAFRIMADRFPNARLVLNETMSWEADGRHRDGVLRLLETARARDLPIHALGVQSHIGKTLARPRNERAWQNFLQSVQDMGFEVLLTEFDCSDRNIQAASPARRDSEVAAHCKGYLDLTLDFANVSEIVVWSLGDGPSYANRPSYPKRRRRNDGLPLRPHPFDSDLRPKPMLDAIKASLRNAPVRRVERPTAHTKA